LPVGRDLAGVLRVERQHALDDREVSPSMTSLTRL
jgi:hypothetical protein